MDASSYDDLRLSLPGELLLLAFDPATGRLLSLPGRRMSRALRFAESAERDRRLRFPGARWRARHAAIRSLRKAKLVNRDAYGRLRLLDRRVALGRMRRIERLIRDNDLADSRDGALAILLAISGILAKRLPRDQLKIAARRLRDVIRRGESGLHETPLTGRQPLTESLIALGSVAAMGSWDSVGDGSWGGSFDGVDGGSQ